MSKSTAITIDETQKQRLIDRTIKQLKNRNLVTPYGFENKNAVKSRDILDRQTKPSLWILGVNYYAKYSSRASWWISASYLAGHSDKQDWAVRIPSTITTVQEALYWLTPRPVRQALEKGKEVYRQGDIYFVPVKLPENDFGVLRGTRHSVEEGEAGILKILHPQHPSVILDARITWRAYPQKQLLIGSMRGRAD